jgi:GT2 family glycosyltransferase
MRVVVVVPMWNQLELTQRCLRSLQELTPQPQHVIVVDNGSWPDPRPALESVLPGVSVVRLERNRGFAGGCNVGIRRALADAADAVLLLNNDAVVDPGALAHLVRALRQDERIAAAGVKTLTDEAPPRIHAAYSVLTFHAPLVRVEGWLEPCIDRFDEERDVDSVSGGAMLIRRGALEAIGDFDEEFFAYHEDVDWCMRARRAGWRIRYVPAARVYHRMHASTGGGYGSPVIYLVARSSVLFVRKHASPAQVLKFAAYTAGGLLKDVGYRWHTGELKGFALRLRGLRDGLLRRPVPLEAMGLVTRAEPADRAATA